MATFRVGQRVVCVKAYSQWPISEGYTDEVAGLYSCCKNWIALRKVLDNGCSSGICRLCGTPYWGEELMFPSNCFRPIEEQSLTAELAVKEVERIVEERPEHVNEPQHA